MEAPADVIQVQTGFDERYIFESITQDITSTECIFDLVDNSIDSIRAALMEKKSTKPDRLGLPATYKGFTVVIEMRDDSISVGDNGAGITGSDMSSGLLVLGRRTEGFGVIGKYGIGLKRALLKLGAKYEISTIVDGSSPYRASFESDQLVRVAGVTAELVPHTWPRVTLVTIKELSQSARNELIAPTDMPESLTAQLSFRYGRFIKKGLVLKLNRAIVPNGLPELRKASSPIPVWRDTLSSKDAAVTILVETGTHEKYRFKGEDKPKPGSLNSSAFGWYVVCNDRVVRIADRSQVLGFPPTWHGEYNGFVGWLHFAGDTRNIPWNTKKTDIDESSDLVVSLRGQLQDISGHYRAANRAFRGRPVPQPEDESSGAQEEGEGKTDADADADADETQNDRASDDSPSDRKAADSNLPYSFLQGVALPELSERIQKVLHEAQHLQIENDGNLCAVILRVLVDLCTSDFFEKKSWRRGSDRDLRQRIEGVLAVIDPSKDDAKQTRLTQIRHDIQNGGLLSHTTLHGFVHSVDHQPTTHDIRVLSKGWGNYIQAINDHFSHSTLV